MQDTIGIKQGVAASTVRRKAAPAAIKPKSLASDAGRSLLRRLWHEEIRHHPGRIATVLALTVVMALTNALYPIVIKRAVDMFTAHDARILYQVPMLVVIVTCAKAASQYGQSVAMQDLVLVVIRGLQHKLFAHLMRADLSHIESEAPAQWAARFTTDAVTIRDAMTRAVNAIGDSVTVVGLVASMIYVDWELSLIAGLLYPIAAVPIQKLGKRIRRASGGMQERIGETAALLTESIAQARTVRAYSLEAMESARAEASFGALHKALLRMTRGRARVDPVMEVVGGTAVALVLGFAGWRAAHGGATLGSFMGFVTSLMLASRPLRALGSLNSAVQEGLAGLSRIFTVLDQAPDVADRQGVPPLPAGPGLLRFEDVRFAYPDGRIGLDGLSFEALPGRTVALVGPSGAGKSTALSLLPRLHDPASGRIVLDGADLRDVSLASLRGAIAYVGQETLLFDTSVAQNIRMGRPDATDAQVREAARAAAAEAFIDGLPEGFDTVVGTGGGRLSGGQRQRVVIARALLRNPRLLLLDEATSALDSESEAAVQAALATLRAGRTTLIVAHRLSTVRSADLVVAMVDGRAAEIGTHAALMEADGVYARLVRTQGLA